MSLRLQTGDLVEIKERASLHYIHVIHLHETYGEILNIVETRCTTRPTDLASIISNTTSNLVIFPLGAAISNKRLLGEIVGNFSSKQAVYCPQFKSPVTDKDQNLLYWWIWDGSSIRPCENDELDADIPDRNVLTHLEFMQRLATTETV